ncbi:MAG: tricarballylate dehydrogenase [Rhodoglobus sp.]|nr:tricarballylate dehydrogenase [Rhodoglobus sp.]
MKKEVHDVIVIGGGNAGLTAALTALEFVSDVVVLEKAPHSKRGGNSFFTGGRMRIPHNGLEDLAELTGMDLAEMSNIDIDPYTEQDFYNDMQKQTRYRTDEMLARLLVNGARDGIRFLRSLGSKFELPLGFDDVTRDGRLKLVGGDDVQHYEGGPGLVAVLLNACQERGVAVRYQSAARQLLLGADGVEGVLVHTPEGPVEMRARGIILASGGYEASPAKRNAYLGAGWDLAKVRGTEFNTGDGLDMAFAVGARGYGHFGGCHSVAADFFADDFGDRQYGDVPERVSYHYGITVGSDGKRYFDEGADMRAYTYARSGRTIVEGTPDSYSVQIFDAKTVDLLRDTYRFFKAVKTVSNDLREIAEELNLNADNLVATVKEFNESIAPGVIDYSIRDGVSTQNITPPKSNWATPLDTPPYTAFAVVPAITFTFGGVKVDSTGAVLDENDGAIGGLYAAGEMVGGIYYHNYPGGSGLVSGTVFGRLAGATAGRRAAQLVSV